MMDDGWASHDDFDDLDGILDDMNDSFDGVPLRDPSTTSAIRNDNAGGERSRRHGGGGYDDRWSSVDGGADDDDDYFREDDDDEDDERHDNIHNNHSSHSNNNNNNNNNNGGTSLFSGFGFGSHANPPPSSSSEMPPWSSAPSNPTRTTGGLGDGGTISRNAHRHDLNLTWTLTRPPPPTTTSTTTRPTSMPFASSEFTVPGSLETTSPPSLRIGAASGTEGTPSAAGAFDDDDLRGASEENGTAETTGRDAFAGWPPRPDGRRDEPFATTFRDAEGEDAAVEGWDDIPDSDDLSRDGEENGNADGEITGERRDETAPVPSGRGTFLLGRAAERFGAALLASVDGGGEGEEQEYNDDEEEEEEEKEEEEYGVHRNKGDDEQSHDEEEDGRENVTGQDCNDDVDGREERRITLDDDNDDDDTGDASKSGYGGFGGGFVMSRLSRFLEVATAPVERDDDDDDFDEDGWEDDDDNLDFGDDGLEEEAGDAVKDDGRERHDDEKDDPAKPPSAGEEYDDVERVAEEEDPMISTEGWDDDIMDADISTDDMDGTASRPSEMASLSTRETTTSSTPRHSVLPPTSSRPPLAPAPSSNTPSEPFATPPPPPSTTTKQTHSTPTASNPKPNDDISDSIQSLVAITESALDSELSNFSWKTPRKETDDGEDDVIVSGARVSDYGRETTDQDGMGVGPDILEGDSEYRDDANGEDAMDGSKTEPLAVASNPPIDTAESAAKDTAEDGDVPKSLSDFANALNAELDSFFDDPEDGQEEVQPNPCVDGDALGEWGKSIDGNSMKAEASTSMDTFQENLQPKESPVQNQQPKESPAPNDEAPYDYELSKNKSPEPVRGARPEHPTLPHQQSWYINAMEDGKGGVVYNDTELESDKPKHPEKGPIIDPVASTHDNESSLQHTPVGMPLSEMPSRSTSPPISSNSEHSFKHSELQCQCLELILPFPENGNVESQEPGYGTKKLPDGNIVLVNYEQLLQNEATKRILLQRSIDTFERTIEKLDARNEASRKWAKEQEDAKRDADAQLVSAHEEIAQLKDVVAQLRLEIDAEKKRAPGSEARLFEEELAASKTQKDELRLEVESLKRELERKNDLCNKFEASQKSLEVALEEIRDEKRRLQSELSESHATAEKLKDTCESLQAQCDGLNVRVEELVSANTSSKDAEELAERLQSTVDSLENDMSEKTKEIEDLKRQLSHSEANQSNITFERNKFQGECTRLDSELSEMKSKLVSLQEEKEAIRSMNTKYEAQIAELNATIESMDDEAVEKDMLAAEVASLKYDLGMKTTECEEAAESLKLLQTKLDCAEARISESSATSSSETLSNVTEPLKAEIEMLEKKLSNSAKALADAENLKAELERKLEDSRRTVVGLETEVKSLHAEVNEVSNLREELNTVKKSLEDTQVKFNELSLSRDQLEVDRNEHDEHVSLLQSTISDLDKQVFSLREEYAELLTTFEDNKRKYKEEHSLMTKRYVILAEEEQKLKVELDDLKEQYDELSKTTSETISKYEQQVLELQGENLEVAAALEVARKNTTNSEELLETKEKLHQEQSRSKGLQNAIEIASSEKDALLKKIDDLRQELESVSREKTHIAQTLEARASAAEHRNNLLNIESATLQKANAESSQTIAKLNEELLVLKEANAKLESKLFDMSFDADQSSALAEENLKLRNERDQLKNEAASFMEKINQMSSQMKSSAAETTDTFSADERDSLLSRISELEEALKNDNLNDLRDELTSLHEERQELDADNEELLVQLGLMQQNEEEMQAELSEMREQVESLETQCKRLQLDLDESRKAIKSSDESTGTGSGMEELRTENAKLCSEIVQLNNERTSLENRIDELQRQLENFEQMSNQDKEVVKGNIETYHLREKLDNLELQVAKRDKELAAMKEEFQSKLDVKDKKISELSSEKCSLENNIKDISKKEELKNAELDSLHQQVETLRIKNEQVADPNLGADVAEEEKEFDDVGDIQDLLAEDVDSDDYLRRQIVVLALALERSEMQRADAIERVVKERKSNAESLKQLGESVKRFYSAVRCSDALSFL